MKRMFTCAVLGIYKALVKNRSLQIEFLVCTPIAFLGIFLGCFDFIPTLICMGMVLSAECLNSSMEQLATFVHPSHSEAIGDLKDIAAGGVLITSLASLFIAVYMVMH